MAFKESLRELVAEAMNVESPTEDEIDMYLHKFGEFFQGSLRFDYQITARMADDPIEVGVLPDPVEVT